MPDDEPDDVLAPAPARTARRLEAVATALFTLVVAWPFLSPAGYVTRYDTVTYAGPVLTFTQAELRAGRLPVWNDQLFGGVPQLANPSAAVLYPAKLPFLWTDPARALPLLAGLHVVLLAGGLFFLLARVLRLRPPAAFVGTAAVVGSGLVMVRSLQVEQISVLAWLPWLLAAVERATDPAPGRGRAVAAVGAITGVMVLAGHPQQTYMSLAGAAVWAACRAHDRNDDIRRRAAALGRVAVGVGIGVLLAAPQLLPTLAQLGASANTGGRTLQAPSNPDFVIGASWLPLALLGNVANAAPLRALGPAEAGAFVGAAVIALAGIGAVVATGSRRWKVTGVGLVVTVAVSLLLSTGAECDWSDPGAVGCAKPGWPYRMLFFHLPGFDQARVPARWSCLAVLALAVLAAIATDALARRAVTARQSLLGSGLAAGTVALGLVVATSTGADWTNGGAASATTIVLWLAFAGAAGGAAIAACRVPVSSRRALVALAMVPAFAVAVELGVPAARNEPRDSVLDQPYHDPSSPLVDHIRSAPGRILSVAGAPIDDPDLLSRGITPNGSSDWGVRSIDGYDGGLWVRRDWTHAMNGFTPDGLNPDLPIHMQIALPVNVDLATRFGVRYLVIDSVRAATAFALGDPADPAVLDAARQQAARGWRGPVATDGSLELWENPAYRAEGRVVFATRSVSPEFPQWDRTLAALALDEALVLDGAPGQRLACASECTALPATLDRPHPGAIDVRVDPARAGLLVVPEQHADGWTATVDGVETPTQTVDGAMIGVPVPAGAHSVALRYHAPGLRLGALLLLLGLAACITLWVSAGEVDGVAGEAETAGDAGGAGAAPS